VQCVVDQGLVTCFVCSRCDIEEEPEDEDAIMELSATYSKFVKRQKYV
jgi:hypothetical protein